LWHFNPRGFSRFASDNGFEVSSFSSLPFDVFYISILSEKYRGTLIPLASGIITGLFFYVLSLFSNLKNSSIIYVLGRSGN
jgi:hypothetical protein